MSEEKKGLMGKIKDFFAPDADEEMENEGYTEETESPKAEAPKTSNNAKKEAKPSKVEDVKNLNIRIIKPGDDKSTIATILDSLKNNQVVVVNFEETRVDIRSSFADAFFGATYVLGANYTKLSETTYVLAPKNVAVSPLIAEMAGATSEDSDSNSRSYFGSY